MNTRLSRRKGLPRGGVRAELMFASSPGVQRIRSPHARRSLHPVTVLAAPGRRRGVRGLHLVNRVIHRRVAGRCRVRRLHPSGQPSPCRPVASLPPGHVRRVGDSAPAFLGRRRPDRPAALHDRQRNRRPVRGRGRTGPFTRLSRARQAAPGHAPPPSAPGRSPYVLTRARQTAVYRRIATVVITAFLLPVANTVRLSGLTTTPEAVSLAPTSCNNRVLHSLVPPTAL